MCAGAGGPCTRFLRTFRFIFNYVCVCGCVHIHVSAGAHLGQKRVVDSLRQSSPVWVIETEHGSFTVHTL